MEVPKQMLASQRWYVTHIFQGVDFGDYLGYTADTLNYVVQEFEGFDVGFEFIVDFVIDVHLIEKGGEIISSYRLGE